MPWARCPAGLLPANNWIFFKLYLDLPSEWRVIGITRPGGLSIGPSFHHLAHIFSQLILVDVDVQLGRLDVLVTQQLLHRQDITGLLVKVRSCRLPEVMRGDPFHLLFPQEEVELLRPHVVGLQSFTFLEDDGVPVVPFRVHQDLDRVPRVLLHVSKPAYWGKEKLVLCCD
jgi:hypothetical protein